MKLVLYNVNNTEYFQQINSLMIINKDKGLISKGLK